MDSRAKVAIAIADEQCRHALSEYLQFQRFEVRTADATTEYLLDTFHEWSPDVLLCEHRLPRLNVITVCRALRAVSMVPILALLWPESGLRAAQALNAGADACISLPCDPEDVLSHLQAVLRRVPHGDAETSRIEVGDFRVIEDTHRCFVAGQEVRLTHQPFSLLLYMLRSGKRVFTHAELAEALWGSQHLSDPEFLRPVVMKLRQMIEPDRRHPTYLVTEYQVGYRFNASRA